MTKTPGQSVRGSTSGRPVMVLLDHLGKRWMLRVLWELSSQGPGTFRQLQERCGDVSPTSLNNRLKELRELQLIERGENGFALTQQGRSLAKVLAPLDKWSNQWARGLNPN